jgi:hypothetical protein
MSPVVINVVEPTLMNVAGHCHSFVDALIQVAPAQPFRVWVQRRAEVGLGGARVQVIRHFSRRLRRLQALFLYRHLLKQPGKLFIATAGRTDLRLLDWAASGIIPTGKAYLFVHWFNANEKKLATLRKIAARQPNLSILAPTHGVIAPFREAGFRHAEVVPYPLAAGPVPAVVDTAFRHLLFAGAARQDKGFAQVVDLVAHLKAEGQILPVAMQISAEHFGKCDAATQADIHRLMGLNYPHLQVAEDTLDGAAYARQFAGAICLQFYDRHDFSDRVSGVTLDALRAGSPVLTSAGTWMARMVQRFGAGLVLEDCTPVAVLAAIHTVLTDFQGFQARAREAGRILATENSAAALYRALLAG